MFNPGAAAGLDATYELRFGDNVYAIRVSDGIMRASGGAAAEPDVVIEADPDTLTELLWRGRPLNEAQDAGDVKVVGKRLTVLRFLKLFAAPRV
jgi:alkyl sulfatase BDS1-like metallo-beta-lactamase superfamily hydrolase